MWKYQKTIQKEIIFHGVGVHTGQSSTLILRPSGVDTGITFYYQGGRLPANWRYVSHTHLSTTLSSNNKSIKTVEHLLSACYGLGITNLDVDFIGSEIPISDGSCLEFIHAFEKAGLEIQSKERSFIVISKEILLQESDQHWICLSPTKDPYIDVTMPIKGIEPHHHRFHLFKESFSKEIAPARTFAHLQDVQWMMQQGLIKGGSLDTALVLDKGTPVNKDGLRLPNECARHKILDIIGDFATLGYSFYGNVKAYAPGHTLNHKMIQTLLSDESAFCIMSYHDLFEKALKKSMAASRSAANFSGPAKDYRIHIPVPQTL